MGILTLRPRRAALLGGLTALVLLVFGVTGIVYCVAGDARGLTREMQRFAPPETSGLPAEAYPELGRHLADYLTGKKDSFQFLLEDGDGGFLPLFRDHELAHMADCRALLSLDHWVWVGSAILALCGLGLLPALAPPGRASFARGALWGLWGGGAAAAVLALWALVDFDGFFLAFHRLAFRNDLWLLDPGSDFLIRLMPEPLFADLGLRGLLVATVYVLLLFLAFLRLGQKNRKTEKD